MIVAIDAASVDLSVALAEPDGAPVADLAWTGARRQSAELLPRLLELMERHGRGIDAVSGLGVGTGPGSFTGLRVAMALAKGLAFGLGRPIVGVPSLPAWLSADPSAAAALARAGAREAYVLRRGEGEVRIADRDELQRDLADSLVVAPGELATSLGLDSARPPRGAAAIAAAAAARLAHVPAGDDIGTLEPIYLRPPRGLAAESDGAVQWL